MILLKDLTSIKQSETLVTTALKTDLKENVFLNTKFLPHAVFSPMVFLMISLSTVPLSLQMNLKYSKQKLKRIKSRRRRHHMPGMDFINFTCTNNRKMIYYKYKMLLIIGTSFYVKSLQIYNLPCCHLVISCIYQ